MMGNWRYRRSRKFYHQEQIPKCSSYYNHEEPPHPYGGFIDDGVPTWEKKFCSLIGLVPWGKVVEAKKYMLCHGNVLNWDDSASEEAFQNAKSRYWAEINGLPCDISLPDPDIYIDRINWNPYIDPEVIDDLDQAYFAPDGEKDWEVGLQDKRTGNLVSIPSEGWNWDASDVKNPREGISNEQNGVALEDKLLGWNDLDTNVHHSTNLNNHDNPWEQDFHRGNKAVIRCTWGDCSKKLSQSNHSGNHASQSKDWDTGGHPWEHSCKGATPTEDRGWGTTRNGSWGDNQQKESWKLDSGWGPIRDGSKYTNLQESRQSNRGWGITRDGSWCNNQQELWKLSNGGSRWVSNFTQANGTPQERGWKNKDGNARGWKRQDNYDQEAKVWEHKRSEGGLGTWREGRQRREGNHQYKIGYKSARFKEDNYQTGYCQHGGRTKKRASFAFE